MLYQQPVPLLVARLHGKPMLPMLDARRPVLWGACWPNPQSSL